MKYINFKNLGIVIFEDSISHIEMKCKLGDRAVSAGFVTMDSPVCSGMSGTLQLESRSEDADRIKCRSSRG